MPGLIDTRLCSPNRGFLAPVKMCAKQDRQLRHEAYHRCRVVTITDIWIMMPIAVINKFPQQRIWQSERPKNSANHKPTQKLLEGRLRKVSRKQCKSKCYREDSGGA
jgi:hypothetical protein